MPQCHMLRYLSAKQPLTLLQGVDTEYAWVTFKHFVFDLAWFIYLLFGIAWTRQIKLNFSLLIRLTNSFVHLD